MRLPGPFMSVTAANLPCGGSGTSKGRFGSLRDGSGGVLPLAYANHPPAPLWSTRQLASEPDSKSSPAFEAGTGFRLSTAAIDGDRALSSLRRFWIAVVTSF